MKFNSALFYSIFTLCLVQGAISKSTWASAQKAERWFEVEVILFKQLGNKAELKEKFPNSVNSENLPKYQISFDLFTPYLQPNLTQLKQFLPLCADENQQQLLTPLQGIDNFISEKFNSIEQLPELNTTDISLALISLHADKTKNNETTQNEVAKNEAVGNEYQNADEGNIKAEADSLINVQPIKYDFQEEALAKPIFSTKELCIISEQEIENYLNEDQLVNFNIDSFDIHALPKNFYVSGAHTGNSPYLIANDSLLLKDISQRLRWSKEFKPLLHFGWRQIGITESKAIPLKLFAGKHIEQKYQQALANYHLETKKALSIEENLLNKLDIASGEQGVSSGESLNQNIDSAPTVNVLLEKAEQKQQALNTLLSSMASIEGNEIDKNVIEDIVAAIDKQKLENILQNNEAEIALDFQEIGNSPPPQKPLQPWMLDGFLKIHLDHYLYITADFNIFNENEVPITTENNNNNGLKLINFSQNRRVITGEVHYFDHPYIGMVIQIRRFDPNKPKGERVSQAIK